MIIGMGHESGLTDVPEAMFIRSMLAAFISTMFMFPMFMPGMFIWPRAPATPTRMRPIVLTQDMTLLPLTDGQNVSADTAGTSDWKESDSQDAGRRRKVCELRSFDRNK